jgi:hypothetical protein
MGQAGGQPITYFSIKTAFPTIVEVKRQTDARLRREVVDIFRVLAELERVKPMKAANAILLTMVLQGSVALSQTTPTEKAAANGTCSTANVGDNNAYNINCNGIGVDQGKKMVEILNRVLANQDPAAVNAKLDELLVVASQPAQTQQALPNILGLTVTPLAPRPNIGTMGMLEGPVGVNPGVTVSFTVDGMFPAAMFSAVCDRPCAATSASVEGASSPKMMTTDKPNIAVVALGLSGPLMPDNKVTITVRSMDAGKISVQNVQSYVQPVR